MRRHIRRCLRRPVPGLLRARTTLAVGGLAFVLLAGIGAALDFLIIDNTETRLLEDAQRAATNWLDTFRPGSTPRPIPKTRIDLLQLVDSHGRVITASPGAAGRPALSRLRPPAGDRLESATECLPGSGCVILVAVRVPPLETRAIWRGEPHFVYAGTADPPLLATHRLELFTGLGVLLAAGLLGWGNWWIAGRTLRPVAVIGATMEEITLSDLSLRVPQPPGRPTEYVWLARTANQTLDRLEAAEKQQRQFASTTSHELRTPLTGLRARLEEAVLYPEDVDPHETIHQALAVTDRLVAMVDDLLVLARLRAGDLAAREPIDLGALIEEEAVTGPGDVPVIVRVDRGLDVRGSRIQLIRVLQNLLANARRHAATRVEVTAERVDGQAVLTVADDGDGIAPQDRERVFERFVRLADGRLRDPAGSGLGLAISRDIAHAHHGTLRIEDSPRGARFALRLPLMDAARRPPVPGISPGGRHRGGEDAPARSA